MNDKGCQGWSSFETWVVNLWLANSAASYRHWRAQARMAWTNEQRVSDAGTPQCDRAAAAAAELARMIKEELHNTMPLSEPDMWSDLLCGALAEVDWFEIAQELLTEVMEEKDV